MPQEQEYNYIVDKKLGVALVGLVLGLVGIIAVLVGQYSTPAVPPKERIKKR